MRLCYFDFINNFKRKLVDFYIFLRYESLIKFTLFMKALRMCSLFQKVLNAIHNY